MSLLNDMAKKDGSTKDEQEVYLKKDISFFVFNSPDVREDMNYCFAGIMYNNMQMVQDLITGKQYKTGLFKIEEGKIVNLYDSEVIKLDCYTCYYDYRLIDSACVNLKNALVNMKIGQYVAKMGVSGGINKTGWYFLNKKDKNVSMAEIKEILKELNEHAHARALERRAMRGYEEDFASRNSKNLHTQETKKDNDILNKINSQKVANIKLDPDEQEVYLKKDITFFAFDSLDVNPEKVYCFAGIYNNDRTQIKDVVSGKIINTPWQFGCEDTEMFYEIKAFRPLSRIEEWILKIDSCGKSHLKYMLVGEHRYRPKVYDVPVGKVGEFFVGDSCEVNLKQIKEIIQELNNYAHDKAVELSEKQNVDNVRNGYSTDF